MKRYQDVVQDCIAQVFGSEAHNCSVVYDPKNGRFYAECGLESKRLSGANYERVINDLFYNFCCEKAAWMGRS